MSDALARRTFPKAGLVLGSAAAADLVLAPPPALAQAPALVHRDRPELTYGVQSGDVTDHRAVVWARADRPARTVEESATRRRPSGTRGCPTRLERRRVVAAGVGLLPACARSLRLDAIDHDTCRRSRQWTW